MTTEATPPHDHSRRWELGVFLAVVAVIIPLLTFFAIATYALGVWVSQMLIFGPPGPGG